MLRVRGLMNEKGGAIDQMNIMNFFFHILGISN